MILDDRKLRILQAIVEDYVFTFRMILASCAGTCPIRREGTDHRMNER
jgi:hypothetical protein